MHLTSPRCGLRFQMRLKHCIIQGMPGKLKMVRPVIFWFPLQKLFKAWNWSLLANFICYVWRASNNFTYSNTAHSRSLWSEILHHVVLTLKSIMNYTTSRDQRCKCGLSQLQKLGDEINKRNKSNLEIHKFCQAAFWKK